MSTLNIAIRKDKKHPMIVSAFKILPQKSVAGKALTPSADGIDR
jgi:hypothetical protein